MMWDKQSNMNAELKIICVIPKPVREEIIRRGEGLLVPGDFARGYLCIDKMGSYIMEDWLNFLVYYGPVVFGNVLTRVVPKMAVIWGHLHAGILYYTRGSGYHEGPIGSPERLTSRKRAADNMWDAAEAMEQYCPANMLTLNLRLVTVHLYAQEDATGAIDNSLEWWNERCIGQISRHTPELTTAVPETVTVNGYLLRERLDDTRSRVNDLSAMAAAETSGRRSVVKDVTSSSDGIYFLDKSWGVQQPLLNFKGGGGLPQVLSLIQGDGDEEWKRQASTEEMEVSMHSRCVVFREEYTSLLYTAVTRTASYNVLLRPGSQYAIVQRYYHVRMRHEPYASVVKLALVEMYDVSVYDPVRATKVLSRCETDPIRLVRMDKFLTKCIIHRCAEDKSIYAIDLVRHLSIARE
jgi:hypothetical protein